MEDLWIIHGGQRRRAETAECAYCHKAFLRRKSNGNPFGVYCNQECAKAARRNRIKANCQYCKVEFERPASKIKDVCYCSRKCKDEDQKSILHKMFEAGCVDCGEKASYYLNLHHVDGNRKNNDPLNWEIVCTKHHATRHLKLIDGEWLFDTSALTPRDMLEKLGR